MHCLIKNLPEARSLPHLKTFPKSAASAAPLLDVIPQRQEFGYGVKDEVTKRPWHERAPRSTAPLPRSRREPSLRFSSGRPNTLVGTLPGCCTIGAGRSSPGSTGSRFDSWWGSRRARPPEGGQECMTNRCARPCASCGTCLISCVASVWRS
jgi:hypothetical protein